MPAWGRAAAARRASCESVPSDWPASKNRGMSRQETTARVRRVAEQALTEKGYVAPIDVLVGLGWLARVRVDEWRQGRLPVLERDVQANLSKVSDAMSDFRRWARERDLVASRTEYVARTRDRRRLRFSVSGKPSIEEAYRTHWVSPRISEAKRRQMAESASRPPELVVINATREWSCMRCSATDGDLLIMEDVGPVCMKCARMDHLVFLARGDAGLTRRARKASTLSAVVVRWSRARKRYERQGLLVEQAAQDAAGRATTES